MAKKKQTGRDLLDQYKQETGYGISRQSSSGSTNGQALLDDYLRNGGWQNVKNGPYNPDYRTNTRKATPQSYEAAYQQYKQYVAEYQKQTEFPRRVSVGTAAQQAGGSQKRDYSRMLGLNQLDGDMQPRVQAAQDIQKYLQFQRKVQTGTAAQQAATNAGQDYSRLIGLNQFDGELERRAAEWQRKQQAAQEAAALDQERGRRRTSEEYGKRIDALEAASDYARAQNAEGGGLPEFKDAYDKVNAGRETPMTLDEMQKELAYTRYKKAVLDKSVSGRVGEYAGDLATQFISGGADMALGGLGMVLGYLEQGANGAAAWALRDLAKAVPDGSIKDKMLSLADDFSSYYTGESMTAGEETARYYRDELNRIGDEIEGKYKGVPLWIQQQMPSAGNMLFGAGLSGIAGVNNLVTLGLTSGGNSALEAKDKGASDAQALAYGVVAGGLEVFSERLFGGNPIYDADAGLVNQAVGKLTSNKTIMKILNSKAFDIASEGLEEVVTEVLDPVAEWAIYNGDNTEFADAASIGNAFLGGVFLSAIGNVADAPKQLQKARYERVLRTAGSELADIAQSVDSADVQEAAQVIRDKIAYGVTPDAADIGAVLDAMDQAGETVDVEQVREAVDAEENEAKAAQDEAAFQTYNQYADERDAKARDAEKASWARSQENTEAINDAEADSAADAFEKLNEAEVKGAADARARQQTEEARAERTFTQESRDDADRLLTDAARRYGFDDRMTSVLLSGYDGAQDAQQYAEDVNAAYEYGRNGMSLSAAQRAAQGVNADVAQEAWNAGRASIQRAPMSAFERYNQYADERDARQAAIEAPQQASVQTVQEAERQQQAPAQTVIQADAGRRTEQYGQQETGSRNGEGRTESVYSGGQSRRMDAGSEIERTLERQGETVRLRNRARNIGAENISPAEAGLKGGDTTKSLLKIPVEAYGEHEKALQKAVEARGASLNIVMGRIRLANGTAVDEFIDTGTRQITVRADCTRWAMENLIDHALFHDLSTEQRNAAAQAVADRFSESELMAIAGQYVKRMRGVYEGMSEEALFNIATEEVLADAAGRMIRYTDADATKFTETVRAILGESIAEPDAEKPTKNQRYSISDRLGEDLRKVFDGTYKSESGEVYIGETSNFLTDVIGADALHVTMPANKAYSAMATEAQAKKDGRYRQNVNYHGLGADGLQRVLNASENPVAAFADTAGANGKRASNIVLVTGEAGKGGPIVVIETLNTKGTLNGKRIDANKVITSYDRAALISDLEAAASDGRLLYLDKKRSQAALAGVPAANSLAAIQGGDFTTNIRNFIAGVKWEKSGASSYTSGAADGKNTFAKAYEEAQQKQRYSPADTETNAETGTETEDAAKKAAEGVPIFNFDAKADWAYSSDPNPFYRLMGITPPGVRVGIVTQGARAADWAGNGKAYTKALLDFVTKPDRSTKTLTLQFPNADGTYRAETVQNTKFMQDVYKYYAETVPEGQRLDEATFWMMRRKLAEGSIPTRIRAMSAEAKGQAWQESSRKDFKSTGALEKMGVKVERSVGRYGKTQTLIEMDKAFKQAKKEVNRAIDRLGATAKEVAFARQIADGVFDMQDIPQGFSKRVVLSLVDYMNAEAALGEDRLAAQRKSIRQDTTAVLETLFKDVKDNKVQDMFTLNHRTAQRNMKKIFGDETGERINKAIFDPIKGNESERIRFINRQFDDVREFADSTGRKSELTHEESILVQLVMEGKATEALLGDMPGNPQITKAGLKIADGMKASEAAKSEHLNKNEKQLAKMYASWVGALRMMADGKIDAVKIDNAAKAYTQKYNEFYAAINDFLVAHGYEPIGFIQNYAPHMQSEESRGALDSALKALGLNEDTVTLPTSIAGLTADFKPNKRWNPYFLHRTSETYNFDAAKGFESYVAYMSEVFYHTDDIMTVRALSDYLRRRYSSEEISFDIDRYTWLQEKLPDEQLLYLQQEGKLPHGTITDQAELDAMIEAELDKLYEGAKNKSTYSNLVVWLDNYANILAGKQTMGDRSTEADFGRKMLNLGNKATRGFGAAKVAGNIATILNQASQLPVIVAEKGVRNTAAAVKDMVTGQLRKADFAMESDYLTSKKGVHFLVTDEKNMYEWALDKVGQVQEFADAMVSTIAVRAAYLEGIQKGMTHEQAMRYADKYGAAVMGDRSKGAKPVAFNSKSPVMQLVNTFQLEVANSWEHLTQDTAGFDFRMMAKKYGKDKAIKALAGVIVKYLIAAFIMNRLSDETYGGTPAQFDVLGITSNFVASGYGLSVNDALRTAMDDGWEKLTGERLFGTENEERSFDGWKALEAAGGDIANDIPYLQNASALIGWGDNSLPAAIPTKALDKWINAVKGGKSAQDVAKATFDVGTEVIPGGSQIKKTARGIDAMLRGGVYQGYGDQTKLRYPVDNKNIGKWIQAVVFGPNGLSETGRYYAGEERAIGEKQTTAYQAMIAAGADKEESYRLIRRISKLGDGEDSKLDKLNMLLSSKVSTAGQGAYYYLMMAGDKERERIDALTGENGVLGMDEYLKASQKKLQIDADESMKASEKADAFRQWANQQGYSAAQKRGVLDAFKFAQIIMEGGGHTELYQAATEGVSEYETLRADAIAAEMAGGKTKAQAESSVNSSLRSQMKQDFQDGLADEETAAAFLKEYCGAEDEHDVYWTLEEWKGGEGWTKYGQFLDAVDKGVLADTRKVAREYMKHGVDKGTLSSQLTTHFKEAWLAATGDEATRLKNAYISAYKAIGGDADTARDNIIKWRQEANKRKGDKK